jgi:hypothetical protein
MLFLVDHVYLFGCKCSARIVAPPAFLFYISRKQLSDSLTKLGYKFQQTDVTESGEIYDFFIDKSGLFYAFSFNDKTLVYRYVELHLKEDYKKLQLYFDNNPEKYDKVTADLWKIIGSPVMVHIVEAEPGALKDFCGVTYYTDEITD